MLNLEKMGLTEMSLKEKQEVEGGFWWIVAIWAVAAIAYTIFVIGQRD